VKGTERAGWETGDEGVLARWGELGRRSSFMMAHILGFKDLTGDLHRKMALWIEGPSLRKLGLVPRDHLKTSLWTIADTMRVITARPLERVLIKNEVADNATAFLKLIKIQAETNELWRALYPERVPDVNGTWNSEALVFPREEEFVDPTVAAIGVGGASTSKHPTLIKEDDLIGREAADSAVKMQAAIDDHKLSMHLISDPRTSQIQTFGTRWYPDDLYTWMLGHERGLDTFITGCYGVDGAGKARDWNDPLGEPIWPERFDRETLENIRLTNGDYLFSLQMLNDPIASGATEFSGSWLRHYTVFDRNHETWIDLEDPEEQSGHRTYPLTACALWQAIDPGLSPESKDARSASVVIALTPHEPYDMVVVSARAKALTPKGCIDLAHEDWERWRPISAGIEVVAGQKTFFYWIPTVYPDMGIYPLHTDSHISKNSRIRMLGPFAQQHRIYVHRTQNDLVTEWETFPNGRTKDLLDALAYAVRDAVPPELLIEGEHEDEELEAGRVDSGRNLITGY
jgi:hypothetical protein